MPQSFRSQWERTDIFGEPHFSLYVVVLSSIPLYCKNLSSFYAIQISSLFVYVSGTPPSFLNHFILFLYFLLKQLVLACLFFSIQESIHVS